MTSGTNLVIDGRTVEAEAIASDLIARLIGIGFREFDYALIDTILQVAGYMVDARRTR